MTKEIITIKVGDEVKSFDFKTSDDCYVQGKVVAIERPEGHSCYCYKIETTKRIFGGKEVEEFEPIYFAPVNGTKKMFGGVCNNVKLVEVESLADVWSKKLARAKLSKSQSESEEDRNYWDGIIGTFEYLLGDKTEDELFWW